MAVKFYVQLLRYVYFIKSIYTRKKDANENAYILAGFFLIINLHSAIVLFESFLFSYYYTFLWKNLNVYKSLFNICFVFLFVFLHFSLIIYFKNKFEFKTKIMILRKSIYSINKFYPKMYIVISTIFFIWSIKIIAVTIYR